MKLLKLSVKSFATYMDQEINFLEYDYPLFIEGSTGAGKTTLFVDAITSALFGRAYGVGDRRYAKEVIMKGKKNAIVELTFEVNGEKYSIFRQISRDGASDAKIYKFVGGRGRHLEVSGITNVDKFVENKLGLSFQTLISSTVVRQGEVHRFIKMKNYERRNFLIELFGFDIFKKYREKCKLRKDKMEREREKYSGHIEELKRDVNKLPEKRDQLEKLLNELPKIENELTKIKEQLEIEKGKARWLNGKFDKLKKELGRYKEMEDRLEKLIREENGIKNKVDTIQKLIKDYNLGTLEKLDELKGNVQELKYIEQKVKLLNNNKEALKAVLDKKSKLSRLEKKLIELNKFLGRLEEVEKTKEELASRKRLLESKIEEIDEHLEVLKHGVGKCPVCGADLSEERKANRVNELIREKDKAFQEINELERELIDIKEEFDNLKLKMRERDKTEATVNELRREINRLERGLEEKRDIKEIEDEIRSLIFKKGELERIMRDYLMVIDPGEAEEKLRELESIYEKFKKLKEYEKELERITVEIIEIEEKLKNKGNVEEEYLKVESELEEVNTKIEELNEAEKEFLTRKAKIETEIENLKSEIRELEGKKRELEELLVKIKDLEQELKALTVLMENVFNQNALPLKLLRDYLKIIQEYTNDYLEKFGQDISIKMDIGVYRGEPAIDIKMYAGSYQRDPITFSGGETTLIGFAIRLAMGKLIAQKQTRGFRPRFLIIDEGFGPLDEELRIKVAEALASLMETGEYEQIIMISHQRELRDAAIFKDVLKVVKEGGRSLIVEETM